MNLQELFEQCLENNNGDKTKAAQQFIIKAKKENPSVKMSECMAIAGYDKKTEQNFRNNIVIPVRNRIANIKFNVSEDSIKRLFGRSQEALTDEEKNTKKSIQDLLPARSRASSTKKMDHIDELING
jgi:hypothetical protein